MKRLKKKRERFDYKDKKYNKNWKARFEGDYVISNEYEHNLGRKKSIK